MFAAHYRLILLLHVGCVIASGGLFVLRWALRQGGYALPLQRPLARLSYGIDTVLLAAAITLTTIIHQYPLRNGWLTMKLALLLIYIGLGSVALKRGRSAQQRALAFVAAVAVYIWIIGVARAHHPLGLLN